MEQPPSTSSIPIPICVPISSCPTSSTTTPPNILPHPTSITNGDLQLPLIPSCLPPLEGGDMIRAHSSNPSSGSSTCSSTAVRSIISSFLIGGGGSGGNGGTNGTSLGPGLGLSLGLGGLGNVVNHHEEPPSSQASSSEGGGGGMNLRPMSPPPIKCKLCDETFQKPKVLPCLHTFCEVCLEKACEDNNKGEHITCPTCRIECNLSTQGVAGLLPDYGVMNLIEVTNLDNPEEEGGGPSHTSNSNSISSSSSTSSSSFGNKCTGCKSGDSVAVARCYDCSNYLCSNCVMAHQFMHCFEGHRLIFNGNGNNEGCQEAVSSSSSSSTNKKVVPCTQHANETLQFYCRTCAIPTCIECIDTEHPKSQHDLEMLVDCETNYVKNLAQYVHEFRLRSLDLHEVLKSFEAANFRLQNQYAKAQSEISEAFTFYQNVLNERKNELTRELESIYISRQVALSLITQRVQDTLDRMYQTIEFSDRLLRHASPPQILVFKTLLETRFQALMGTVPDSSMAKTAAGGGDVEFVSNYSAMQTAVRNTLGYIRSSSVSEMVTTLKHSAAISRPLSNRSSIPQSCQEANLNSCNVLRNTTSSSCSSSNPITASVVNSNGGSLDFPHSKILENGGGGGGAIGSGYSSAGGMLPYEKWSSAGEGMPLSGQNDFLLGNGNEFFPSANKSLSNLDCAFDLTAKMMNPLNLKNPGIKRQKMIYHCKFGEFGTGEAQFTEPSGVAVTGNNEIVVADTNNHRIQIFDHEGRFKFQFGECGKRDGQLLYPNRVAVFKLTGDIVVTERSPTHQIQIYNQYGQFVCKFGANILQHPRGVTVDHKGRVIVVECKVMRVVIFDQNGTVINKFGCSKHLEFPNGVVVNDREEIFISDNRAHCVKVFNYDGVYLRQIGNEGLTNYPIGVGINAKGEILVADNHNNFNLTIFTQDGQLVSALESKVKHAQCFDVALLDDGSVVLASKDYRLYVYRYTQPAILGL